MYVYMVFELVVIRDVKKILSGKNNIFIIY